MIYIKTITLRFLLFLLNSCGENTTAPVTTDVAGMTIDTPTEPLYSTNTYSPTATSTNDDGEQKDATNNVDWKISDNTLAYISNAITIFPLKNDGNFTLSAGYKSFEYFENNITLDIVGITDLNSTWWISSSDVNETGTYIIKAEGNYTDGTTQTIVRNISWISSNTSVARITIDENYVTTLNVIATGDVNITAKLFNDVNTTKTKSYTIT